MKQTGSIEQRCTRAPQATDLLAEVDSALATETHTSPENSNKLDPRKKQHAAAIGFILRYAGTIIFLISALAFLLQKGESMSETVRYLSFLAYTAVLCGAGVFCGVKIDETKGARTLLALAVSIVPIHFAQLGALIYRGLGFAAVPATTTVWSFWTTPSLNTAGIVTALGVTILIPITYFSYSVLARDEARRLTVLAIGAASLLLIPTRDGILIPAITAIAVIAAAKALRTVRNTPSMRTIEGGIAQVTVVLPIALLIARQMYLYDVELLGQGVFCALVSFTLFGCGRLTRSMTLTAGLEIASLIPSFIACVAFAGWLRNVCGADTSFMIVVTGLLFSAACIAMSVSARAISKELETPAAVAAVIPSVLVLATNPTLLSSLTPLITGLVVITLAYLRERRWMLLIGAVGAVSSILYHLHGALNIYATSPWMTLGGIGIGTVLAASYLERNFTWLTTRLEAMKRSFTRWS